MAGVHRFEDLVAWQKARLLVSEIYSICRQESVCRDFGFCNQYRSAALSVMSNIAEGFERRSSREFARFLDIAIASCGEVRSQTYAALDLEYVSEQQFDDLQNLLLDVSRLSKALRTSLNSRTG